MARKLSKPRRSLSDGRTRHSRTPRPPFLAMDPPTPSSAACLAPDDTNSQSHCSTAFNHSVDYLLMSPTARRPPLPARKLTKRRPVCHSSTPPSSYPPSASRPLSWYSVLVPSAELSPRPLSPSDIALAKGVPYDPQPQDLPPPPAYEPAAPTPRRTHRLSLRELAADEAISGDTWPRARPRPTSTTPISDMRKRHRSFSFLPSSLRDPDANMHMHMRRPSRRARTLAPRSSTDALSSLALTGVVSPVSPPADKAPGTPSPPPKSILKTKSFSQPPLSRMPTTASASSSSTLASPASASASPASPALAAPARRRSARTASSAELQRGWSFAMAMSDEGVTDEALVAELERLRRVQARPARGADAGADDFVWMVPRGRARSACSGSGYGSGSGSGRSDDGGGGDADGGGGGGAGSPLASVDSSHTLVNSDVSASPTRTASGSGSADADADADAELELELEPESPTSLTSPSPASEAAEAEDEALWHTARRALLCCREIVRTERRYEAALSALLAGRTAAPPPPLMRRYLPALLRASQRLLRALAADPSAWGVAAAFVAAEEEVAAGMAAWAGVVGQFFAGGEGAEGGVEKERKGGKGKRRGSDWDGEGGWLANAEGLKPSRSRLWRNRSAGMLPSRATALLLSPRPQLPLPPSSADKETEKEKDRRRKLRKSRGAKAGSENEDGKDGKAPAARKEKEKQHSVRDLAIQPTQRVMRYVMLYRDLLDHTPATSPAHALVQSALEAAQRMARQCDRAQTNAAFLPHAHARSLPPVAEARPRTMIARLVSTSHARFSAFV